MLVYYIKENALSSYFKLCIVEIKFRICFYLSFNHLYWLLARCVNEGLDKDHMWRQLKKKVPFFMHTMKQRIEAEKLQKWQSKQNRIEKIFLNGFIRVWYEIPSV